MESIVLDAAPAATVSQPQQELLRASACSSRASSLRAALPFRRQVGSGARCTDRPHEPTAHRALTRRIAARLPKPVEVLQLDVTDDADLDSLDSRVGEQLEQVDGILHAIGFAGKRTGGGFMTAPWSDVANRNARVDIQPRVADPRTRPSTGTECQRRRTRLRCICGMAKL